MAGCLWLYWNQVPRWDFHPAGNPKPLPSSKAAAMEMDGRQWLETDQHDNAFKATTGLYFVDFSTSLAGFLLSTAGSLLLYACSNNQRLLKKAPRGLLLPIAAILMLLSIAAWASTWGGLVGGLLALLTWMMVSLAVPYLLARRGNP